MNKRKKLIFYSSFIVILLLVVFIIGEIGIRLLGFKPDNVDPRTLVRVVPGNKFYQPDSNLGYSNIPGKFRVFLTGGYSFSAIHGENTLRITHPQEEDSLFLPKEKIWILGCSNTYGWSINDNDIYPWRLQLAFPQYEVVNYGVCGYGTVHSLLQLKHDLAVRQKPKLVIYSYFYMHDDRNTLTVNRRKAATKYNFLGPICQPYASFDNDGRLVIMKPVDVDYNPVPFDDVSALIHFLERVYNTLEARFSNSKEVTRAIIDEMYKICKKENIVFVLAGIDDNSGTTEMLKYFQSRGVPTVDISVNNEGKKYNNLPFDSHPNSLAHEVYSQKLENFIMKNNLLH